jgi:hypothetical protein
MKLIVICMAKYGHTDNGHGFFDALPHLRPNSGLWAPNSPKTVPKPFGSGDGAAGILAG